MFMVAEVGTAAHAQRKLREIGNVLRAVRVASRRCLEMSIQGLLNGWVADGLSAETPPWRCSRCGAAERGCFRRNGSYSRQLQTMAGVIQLQVPRLRCTCGAHVALAAPVLEPRRRHWWDVWLNVVEGLGERVSIWHLPVGGIRHPAFRRWMLLHYYGIDVHKRFCAFTCIDDGGRVIRRGRVANTPETLGHMVAPSGGEASAVLEATGNWTYIYDTLEPWVAELILAHPLMVRAIAAAKVKTDRIDADTLAQLLRAGLIPRSYVPPSEVRELRDWLRSRTAVVRMATQLKNRIHAILAKNGLVSPVSDLFGKTGRAWLQAVELKPVHRRIVERYLAILDSLQADVREVTAEVARQARQDPRARLLMTIPGIGPLTALLFLAEVGDLQRFPDAAKLVSFAGLAPRVRASGGRVHLGHITKQGSAWLRWTFTEAAARTGRNQGSLGQYYRHIQARHGNQTAVTALARKLLTIAYFVVKTGRPYEERG